MWATIPKSYKWIGGTLAAFMVVGVLALSGMAALSHDWNIHLGDPKSGTVLDKRYEPARTWQEWESCHTSYYTTEMYTDYDGHLQSRQVQHCQGGYETRYDDEDYKVKLKTACKQREDGTEHKCWIGWREVKKKVYPSITVGTFYDGKGNV